MKKAVKGLIVAASVAAVVGVAGVSFAKWEGSNTSATVSGNTATIVTVGLTGTLKNDTAKLMPWDQVEGANGENLAREYVVELTLTGDSIADKDIQVTYTGTLASGSNYMVKFDSSDTVATTVADKSDYNNILTAASGTAKYDITGSESDNKIYAHIILDSTNPADMTQSVTFTFELVEHAD